MKKIKAIIMFLLVVCLMATVISMDSLAAESTYDESEDPGKDRYTGNISEDFYQMDSLIQPRAITHNNRFDGYTIEKGIDVSEWQGTIDWKKVAADGIDFAIIRVGYRGLSDGSLNEDPYFEKNIEGALKNGIKVGVYMFSQALTEKEAISEANYLIKRIEDYKIELPLVMDYEYGGASNPGRLYKANLSKRKATNNCLAFCETVEAEGYKAMVYANKTFLRDDLYCDEISEDYEIWLAHYTNKTDSTADYTYWQYSSSGSVKGISGNVDMNFHYVNDKNITRPVVKIADRDTTAVTLEWSKDGNAAGYEIYASKSGGSYTLVGTVEGKDTLTFMHKDLSMGTSYKYKVRAIYNSPDGTVEYGTYSSVKEAVTKINYSTEFTKTSSTFDTVTLNWDKVTEKIKGYKIYNYNATKGEYTLIKTISDPDTLTYTHTGRNSATTYKYKIRPYNIISDVTIWGNYSEEVSVKTASAGTGVVTGNKISVRTGAGSSYSRIKYATKGEVYDLVGSTNKWFKISFEMSGKEKTGYISKDYMSVVEIPGKTTLKASATTYDKVKLTWDKVSGASGYQIQRYDSETKKYKTVKTITSGSTTSYSNGYRNCDTTYKYRIRAYKTYDGVKVYGSYSSAASATTTGAIKGTTTSALKVRKSASTSASSWTTIKKNATITITGKRDGWYRVSVTVSGKTRTGYVKSKYVKL